MNYANNKKIILGAVCCVLLLATGCQQKNSTTSPTVNNPQASTTTQTPTPYTTPLRVGDTTIHVAIARTTAQQEQGLSGREPLSDTEGMLFIFKEAFTPLFWMKQMKFDLDIIWIRDNTIISIDKNIPKPANPAAEDFTLPTYTPPSAINQVLEVAAGWSDQHNIHIGDTVTLQK